MVDEEELAVEKYRLFLNLWKSENPIKTIKFQMLMVTNALLVVGFFSTERSFWIPLVGFAFSFIWTLSIGRTVGYQHHWHSQLEDIRRTHPRNAIFQIHSARVSPPVWGRVSSKYYLLGTPALATISWLGVVLYIILT